MAPPPLAERSAVPGGILRQVALTLACAEEDEATLAGLVAALRRERLNPELIVGIDTEPRLFGQAIDEQEGAAVFAICNSYQLDPAILPRLEGLFSARRGPEHSLITLNIERTAPAALVNEIRAAMSVTKEDELVEYDDDRVHLREVVGVTEFSAVPPSAPAAPASPAASAATSASGSGAFNAAGTGGWSPTGTGSFRRSPPPPNQPAPPGSNPSFMTASGRHQVSPSEPLDKPPPRGPARLPPKKPPPEVEKSEPIPASPSVAPASSTSALFIALVGGLAAAVAVFGLWMLTSDTQPESPLSRRAPVPAASPPVQGQALEPDPEASGTSGGGVEGTGTTGGDEAAPSVDLDAPLTDVQESERLGRALAEGKIQALGDEVFFADSRSTTWHEAANFCKASPVKGVLGFRVPSKKTLRKIGRAGLLEEEGRYWSSTLDARAGGADTHVFTFDSGSKRMESTEKSEQAMRVCVRPME